LPYCCILAILAITAEEAMGIPTAALPGGPPGKVMQWPVLVPILVACIAAVASVTSAWISKQANRDAIDRLSSQIQDLQTQNKWLITQLTKPEAKIVWPYKKDPAPSKVYVAGWSRNIPAGEQLFVALRTQENGETYFVFQVNRLDNAWKTEEQIYMSEAGKAYHVYVYALKENRIRPPHKEPSLPEARTPLDDIDVTVTTQSR
jgi:hypothetical protein